MKKAILYIALIAAAGTAGYFIFQHLRVSKNAEYEAYALPKLHILHIAVTKLTDTATSLSVIIRLKNKTPIGFRADSLRYKIYIQGKEVARNAYPHPIALKSGDSIALSVPIVIENKALNTVLTKEATAHTDSVYYKVTGSALVHLPLIDSKTFTYTDSLKAPVIHIPTFQIEHVALKGIHAQGVSLIARINLNNPNAFALNGKNNSFRISLNGHKAADGTVKGTLLIPPHKHTVFEQPIEINLAAGSKAITEMLRQRKPLTYTLQFRTEPTGKGTFIKGSTLLVTASGTVKALREAVKSAKRTSKKVRAKTNENQETALLATPAPNEAAMKSREPKPGTAPVKKKRKNFFRRLFQ